MMLYVNFDTSDRQWYEQLCDNYDNSRKWVLDRLMTEIGDLGVSRAEYNAFLYEYCTTEHWTQRGDWTPMTPP